MGARTLGGEHDFRLGFSFARAEFPVMPLPLDAETGLLGIGTLEASGPAESISNGLDFTLGEVPRDGPKLFKPVFLPDEVDTVDAVGLRVGVDDLSVDLEMMGIEGLELGVDERGVEEIRSAEAGTGLEDLDVGVEERVAFDFEGKEGRPVGVAALRAGFRAASPHVFSSCCTKTEYE